MPKIHACLLGFFTNLKEKKNKKIKIKKLFTKEKKIK
jgi:hypothetical protein